MRRSAIVISALVLALTGIACSGAGATDGGSAAGPGAQAAATPQASAVVESAAAGGPKGEGQKIVLEVTGPAKAGVTYMLGADSSQDNGTALPWKKELTSADEFLYVSIVAQKDGAGAEDIACKITIDGKVVKENRSTGDYAVVTCNHSAF
ncbi:hypothetical protein J2S43_005835 [Catenuloplanes nepalensis]|uniref:MmpS family membrane protein n=1 Tax=Catenuloplanes nepalensis TaxID=587533 RepID=A0ABT9N0W2_9ACTN|nr:MmpS family transport accessory protein [Catenuloplanes nepalensis]MDP9797323.1 hypothetical protein [Catenuloplanes nepalensis]